jgi:hypothetical protein
MALSGLLSLTGSEKTLPPTIGKKISIAKDLPLLLLAISFYKAFKLQIQQGLCKR